jgi:hypothetical protein
MKVNYKRNLTSPKIRCQIFLVALTESVKSSSHILINYAFKTVLGSMLEEFTFIRICTFRSYFIVIINFLEYADVDGSVRNSYIHSTLA